MLLMSPLSLHEAGIVGFGSDSAHDTGTLWANNWDVRLAKTMLMTDRTSVLRAGILLLFITLSPPKGSQVKTLL